MTFDRKSQADLLTVVLRGTAWTVPRALVRRVDFAGPVTPLPFAAAPVEGLTMVDGKPLLQMRPAEDAGQPAQPGNKLLVIDTATGPVALRADRIAAGLLSAPALILDGLPADYAQAPAAAAESAARPAAGARPLTLLFAVMGGETVAFPAAIIERVDHVISLRALDGDPSGLKLAALEGELVPARPGAPCFGGDGAGDTAWALVVARGDERLALLASRVLGLREVPPSRLRRVPVPGGRPSFWVHTEEGGLARLADPRLWVWPDGDLAPCLAGFHEETAKAAQWSGIGEYRGGLCLRAGGLRLSLPLATVSQVLGRLDRLAEAAPISRRRPRGKALPVLDAAVLLGRREQPRPGLGVVIGDAAGRRAILSADAVESAPGSLWQPLPAVPAALHALFDGVLGGDPDQPGWAYRLRSQARLGSLARAVPDRIRPALMGWVGRASLTAAFGVAEDETPGAAVCSRNTSDL